MLVTTLFSFFFNSKFFKMVLLLCFLYYLLFCVDFSGIMPSILVYGYGLLDKYSFLFIFLSLCIILFSLNFMKCKALKITMGSLLLMLVMAFGVSKFFLFFIFFELSLIPMLMMILGWGNTPERLSAGSYLLMYTMTSSMPLFLLFFGVFSNKEDLSFFSLSCDAHSNPGSWNSKMDWFLFMWIVGFFVKIPVYGFHLWLTKAHVEAPVYGSMMLAAVLLKLGMYGLFRSMFFWKLNEMSSYSYFQVFLVFGFLISGIVCFRQVDMKSLIAYSSVQHMMLGVIGVLSYSELGAIGMLWMSVSHGFVSSALFFMFKVIYGLSNTRKILLNYGLMNLIPCFMFFWMLALALKSALPPSGNFFSEIFLMGSFMPMGGWFYLVFVTSVFFSGLFSIYLYSMTSHGYWKKIMISNVSLLDVNLGFLQCVPALLGVMFISNFF